MTFAAMLLMSVSAFAQSSETPLKGDVNEDGVVDVADINAIIAIIKNNAKPATPYYWYIGPVQPTIDNYQSIATEVTSYNESYEYTNNGTRTYHYILVAADQSISIRDALSPGLINIHEETSVNIPGHRVYKTNGAISVGGTMIVDFGDEWKHFYLGTPQPTEDNMETLTPSYKSFEEMNNTTIHVPAGGKLYILFPYSNVLNFNRLQAYAFTDSEGNNNIFSTRSISYFGRHYCGEMTVDEETMVTFRYPYE